MLSNKTSKIKEINGLEIIEMKSVSGIKEGSIYLADYISKYKGKKVLDMGCGTGYIAIYLSKLGFDVEASDINKNAIKNTLINMESNEVKFNVIQSNLFSNINNKYDIICFNIPFNMFFFPFDNLLKYYFDKFGLSEKMACLGNRKLSTRRKKFIFNFLKQSTNHLNPNGFIIIHSTCNDVKFLEDKGYNTTLCKNFCGRYGVYKINRRRRNERNNNEKQSLSD